MSPWWHGDEAAALAALHLYLVAAKEKAYGSRDFAPDETENWIARNTMNGGNPAKAGRAFTDYRFRLNPLVGD